MSKLIDKATAHFEDVLAGGVQGPIRVDAWDADIYYKPTTTMQQESIIIKLTQDGKATEALIQTLIMKACDKDGKAVFEQADKVRLMNAVDPKIILDIVTKMNATDEDIEDALGN